MIYATDVHKPFQAHETLANRLETIERVLCMENGALIRLKTMSSWIWMGSNLMAHLKYYSTEAGGGSSSSCESQCFTRSRQSTMNTVLVEHEERESRH